MQTNNTQVLSNSEIRDYLEDLVGGSEWMPEETMQQKLDLLRSGVFGADHDSLLFPTKLFKLVSCSALSPDMFWLDGGNAFAVDRVGFQRHIMTIFFDQHQYKSFQTMLSRYGFHAIAPTNRFTDGRVIGNLITYSHPLFREGREELAKEIMPVKSETRHVQANPNGPLQEIIVQAETNATAQFNSSSTSVAHFFEPGMDDMDITGNALDCMSVESGPEIDALFDLL